MFFISVVSGQLFMSMIIDTFGLFNSEKISVSSLRVVGIVLVFLGAITFRLLPFELPCNGKKKKVETVEEVICEVVVQDSCCGHNIDDNGKNGGLTKN
eukprot:Pgem_evm1s1903